jgi:2-C-methyl-D-erythritol 4-phosphate cytidylyltransferase
MRSVWVIVVAAGSGSRFGRPKQYEELAGRPVLDWSLAAALAAAGGADDGLVVVVPPDRVGEPASGAATVVGGGATRSSSVRAGLAAVPGHADVIVVHDGARPLAGPELFARVVGAVRDGADAAVPAVEVTDTLRRRTGGPVDRNGLLAVQTPQAFRAAALRRARGDRRCVPGRGRGWQGGRRGGLSGQPQDHPAGRSRDRGGVAAVRRDTMTAHTRGLRRRTPSSPGSLALAPSTVHELRS